MKKSSNTALKSRQTVDPVRIKIRRTIARLDHKFKPLREAYTEMPTGAIISKDFHPVVSEMPLYKTSSRNIRMLLKRMVHVSQRQAIQRQIYAPMFGNIYRQAESDDDAYDRMLPVIASMVGANRISSGRGLEADCAQLFEEEGLVFEPQPKISGRRKGLIDFLFIGRYNKALLEDMVSFRERFAKAIVKLNLAEELLDGKCEKYILIGENWDVRDAGLNDLDDENITCVSFCDELLEKLGHHNNLISLDEFIARVKKTQK